MTHRERGGFLLLGPPAANVPGKGQHAQVGAVSQCPPHARDLIYHRVTVSFSEIMHRAHRAGWGPSAASTCRPRCASSAGRRTRPNSPYLISVFPRGAHRASWTGEPHRTLEAVSASWALGPFLALQRREDPQSNTAPLWECPATISSPQRGGAHRRGAAAWASDPWHSPNRFQPATRRVTLSRAWPRATHFSCTTAFYLCPSYKEHFF